MSETCIMKSETAKAKESSSNVVNLNLFRIKKSLLNEGFEVVENPDGKITLVIRISK